jgi:histidinol-phosphate aminotransferase
MKNYLSNLVNSIKPYAAGEQPKDKKYIKLNTNENPYPPSPKVKEAILNYNFDNLKLYPDPDSTLLKNAIAKKEGVNPENVFIGNGSDEVLALCFPTFFNRDDKDIAFADITYSFYPVFCDFFGINCRKINVEEDFSIFLTSYLYLKNVQGKIIANPNAPTGRGIELTNIKKIVQSNPDILVLIDEAYMDFFKQSAVELTKTYKNVIVVKTFSKSYSLAGIRCCYAIGDKELIAGLETSKNSFNSYPIDRLCEVICSAAINDSSYYDSINNKIIEEREILQKELKKLGLIVIPSNSNFIFAGLPNKGKLLYEKLKEKGILVRYFEKDRIKSYIRITIGSKDENYALITNLRDIIEEIANIIV